MPFIEIGNWIQGAAYLIFELKGNFIKADMKYKRKYSL